MALFQKKPQVTSSTPLYSVGAGKTVLVVGLGNPGKKYQGTRHNVGFAAIEAFAKANEFPAWQAKKDLKAELSVHNLSGTRVILARPATFMNLSGEAVQQIQHFYKVYNPNTLVVYDELAIPFGQLRTRVGGSDAGHNGVKSLIQRIGDDFSRLRLGIGNPTAEKTDAADFVLKKFDKAEQGHLQLLIQEAGAMITEYIYGGALPAESRTIL